MRPSAGFFCVGRGFAPSPLRTGLPILPYRQKNQIFLQTQKTLSTNLQGKGKGEIPPHIHSPLTTKKRPARSQIKITLKRPILHRLQLLHFNLFPNHLHSLSHTLKPPHRLLSISSLFLTCRCLSCSATPNLSLKSQHANLNTFLVSLPTLSVCPSTNPGVHKDAPEREDNGT